MVKRDNFFALLGDDDEGVDLMTLVARAEAKAAAAPVVAASATDAVAANHSQRASADQGRMERERGRHGRYQRGHGGPQFEEADGNEVKGQSMDGFTMVYHGGDSAGRGRRGRGRGRGYTERTFGNESQFYNTENQGQNIAVNEDVTKDSKGPSRYEKVDRKMGDENQKSKFEENQGFKTVERRNYSGDNRSVRGGRGYGGNRGFRGGEYRDENGHDENGFRERRGYGNANRRFRGEAQRYVPRNEVQDEGEEVKKTENAEEVKEDAAARKDQGANNAKDGENESGWDMPEATEAVTDGKSENINPEKKKTEEDEETRRKRMEAEEEAKKITLAEYEKLLQEKRKVLEAMRSEAKRVVDEKEFEGMQLVEKKKEEELFVKLKMDKEKQKKKEGVEKEEKARKSVSINVEYYGGRGRGRGRGQHNRYRGGHRLPDAPVIEDPSQFPILGQAVKA